MSCLSLLDDCVMIKYSKEIQMLCQDFSCGNEDLDDFFKNGAIKYDEDLMGKTYCWLTETKPHKVVALVTLANDSIKTAFIGKPSRNKLNRSEIENIFVFSYHFLDLKAHLRLYIQIS